MNVSRRTLIETAVAGTVLTAGCADDGPTDTEPGEEPGVGDETATTTSDDAPDAGGNESPEGTETETETEEETPTEGESAATVQVASHPDHGEILVGPEEMTLYMFDQDEQDAGESACIDDCAGNWPPSTVDEGEPEAGEGVTAELSTFEREDGDTQVAANGWPLYYFASDEEPGDANGQAANDVWWVLDPDGSPIQPRETDTGTDTQTGTETPTPTDSQ